jgi:AcrR family transcriptional regulator
MDPMPKIKSDSFQRARQPAQIEQRREAILRAALILFQRNGLENVSLNDIAREVGLAKSNIYRYFESREHIYLVVLQRLAAQFEQRLYPALERLRGRGTVAKVTEVMVSAYLDSPEYGELITVVNSVLEKRLTPALVVNFRSVFLERRKRLAAALAAALAGATPEKLLPLTLHIFLHAPELWTFCFPRPDSRKLLDEPAHQHLKFDFKKEMTLFLRAILRDAVVPETARD